MKQRKENRTRSKRIAIVVDGEYEGNVTDVLTDLRHYCDAHALCFGDLDRTAYQHYLAETAPSARIGQL